LIKAKREKDLAKIIKTFPENPDLKVLHGRWGPCITLGKDFFRIPKDKEPGKLTFANIIDIIGGMDAYEQVIANAAAKKGKFGAKKGKAEPKTAAKGKTTKVIAIKKAAKKVAGKKPVFKKAASKSTAPKRVIKATRKKAAKRK